MRPNKILFFGIISLAIVVVIGMFLAVFLFLDDSSLDLSTTQQDLNIRVVVAPSVKEWATQAAREFNSQNPKTQIEIITADELIPENQFKPNNPQDTPPAAWLAESSFVVEMAQDRGLKFADDLRSVAGTSLTWGAFSDKQEAFSQEYGNLTWESVHAKAVSSNDYLTIVLASPSNRAEGLAALISATAAQLDKQSLSNADITQARPWLTETFKDNTRFPPKPAEAFASTQGRSIGDVGLLSRASWQQVGLQDRPDDFTLTPAQPDVYLDYPLAIWTGSQATPTGQQAAAQFRDFLLSDPQQQALANFSFEPAGAAPPMSVQIDGPAAWALLRFAEQELTP